MGAAILLGAPAAATAQDVAIAHDEIGCVVVGKYPRLDACFTPSSLVGKARVYFRPETHATWFYVEMDAREACHSGVLPKPTKALIDKKIFYYVDVQGAGTARTPEYAPVVVAREMDCKKVAAPFAPTGPGPVYPSLPAGFATAGISGTVIAAGATVVVAGGLLVTGDADAHDAGPMTPPAPPVTNLPGGGPTTTAPPPTPPPTLQPLALACKAAPRSGEAPLRVEFFAFPSGATGSYVYLWTFGDGETSSNPNPAHTFLDDGVYDATVRVTSGDQAATCTRQITVARLPEPAPSPSPAPPKLHVVLGGTGNGTVTGPGISCPTDCDEVFPFGTVVTLSATPDATSVFKEWTGHCTGTGPCVVTMNSNRNVVALFERLRTLTLNGGFSSDIAGSVTSSPAGISCAWDLSAPCTDTGTFPNGTAVTLTVTTTGLTVLWGGGCAGTTGPVCTFAMNGDLLVTVDTLAAATARTAASTPLRFSSQFEVPDGEGQIVLNGRDASAARPGLSVVAGEIRAGTNRVEAVLVRGAGRQGAWRFDLSRQASLAPGSLRVVAGNVTLLSGDTAVFHLQGRPGERIVFTFEVEE